MEAGRVVYSKAGRDKRDVFIVISSNGEYVFLANGKTRLLERPKKKQLKHIQPTNIIIEEIRNKLINNSLNNADLKKALLPYSSYREA